MRRVALTFDYDALSVWINHLGPKPGSVSRGEFGKIGVERVLEVLEHHEVQATFFVPGHTALAFPDSVRAIDAAGHEIAHHGFVHERIGDLTPQEERRVMERGLEALEGVVGVPVGYRSPSWEFTPATPQLLSEFGFLYDSSLMATDFTLYWPRAGDQAPPDGPYVFGAEVPVVEVPVSWLLNDFPHFEFVAGGVGPANVKSPAQVYEIWMAEFEFFAECPGAECFTLTLHPQVIGRGSRIAMLDRMIGAMKATADISFSSLRDVAQEWKQGQSAVPAFEES